MMGPETRFYHGTVGGARVEHDGNLSILWVTGLGLYSR